MKNITRLLFLALGSLAATTLPFDSAKADNAWCTARQAPQINIKTSTDNISYDFSKSEKQLNTFHIDSVNPYGDNVITDVGGLMEGGISLSQSMEYGTLTNTGTQQICYWYTKVDVTLHIQPTIYVASEFPKGSCKHNAILEHEHQHVIIDREIVNKYAALIGTSLQTELARQKIYGPIPLNQKTWLEQSLKDRMQSLLSAYGNQMNAERKQRQQAFDNINEYQRVNKMCR